MPGAPKSRESTWVSGLESLVPDDDQAAATPEVRIGPYQLAREARRGRHGDGLGGGADRARQAPGGAEGDQGRHGLGADPPALRGRASGAGADGPPEHRHGAGRGHFRGGPAVLRDGAGQGSPHHDVLRRAEGSRPRAAEALRGGLPRDPARTPEGNHPPRHQAGERAGLDAGRRAGAEGDRLRRGQGAAPAADRSPDVHGDRRARGDARVHESRADGAQHPGHRHACRRLRAGRAALRAPHRDDAARREAAAERPAIGDAPSHPRGGPAEAQRASDAVGRSAARARGAAACRSRAAHPGGARRAGLDRDEGPREGPDAALRSGERAGERRRALSPPPAGRGRSAHHALPGREVPAPAPRRRAFGRGRRGAAGGGGRGQHLAGGARDAGRAERRRGQRVPAERPAGPGGPREPDGRGRGARPRREGANAAGPRRADDRGQVPGAAAHGGGDPTDGGQGLSRARPLSGGSTAARTVGGAVRRPPRARPPRYASEQEQPGIPLRCAGEVRPGRASFAGTS